MIDSRSSRPTWMRRCAMCLAFYPADSLTPNHDGLCASCERARQSMRDELTWLCVILIAGFILLSWNLPAMLDVLSRWFS